MKVLVLDDEPWNVSWLRPFITSLGGTCDIVTTYEDAVAYVSKATPHIAVVDIMIGSVASEFKGASLTNIPEEWQGLKFIRHLRAEARLTKRDTEIVVYSVIDNQELADLTERAFGCIFCTKSDLDYFRFTMKKLCKGSP